MDQPELRLSDCPTAEVSVVIAATPRAVWPLVSDIQLPARFSSEFQGAEWLDGAPGPSLGARFKGRNHHPARGEWETTSTICEYQPERQFGWAVGSPEFPAARWRFDLEPQAAGETRLTQWVQLGPGPSGISYVIESMPHKESRILRRRLAEHQANMQATIAGIKNLAET
ncbi:MAG TPA: SRPBCC family protein [Streptosporangiaceae bacterium]|nr:SRPBCC family protein [Streptosporangiaceae bacterium]